MVGNDRKSCFWNRCFWKDGFSVRLYMCSRISEEHLAIKGLAVKNQGSGARGAATGETTSVWCRDLSSRMDTVLPYRVKEHG